MIWFVYIIRSSITDRLYTGITTDLDRRLREHNGSRLGAKATRAGRPWEAVYKAPYSSKSEALRQEHAIKRLSRKAKLDLVSRHRETSPARNPLGHPGPPPEAGFLGQDSQRAEHRMG